MRTGSDLPDSHIWSIDAVFWDGASVAITQFRFVKFVI